MTNGLDNTNAPTRAHWTDRAGNALIGQVDWQPPRWFRAWRADLKTDPMRWLSAAFVVIAALLWGNTRPEPVVPPDAVGAELTAPERTDYTKTPPVISPLRLRFSGSAAPLEKIGEAPEGVTLTPAQPGAFYFK